MEFEIIDIVPILAMSELARQVANESTLSQGVKRLLHIDYDRVKKWKTLSKPAFWVNLSKLVINANTTIGKFMMLPLLVLLTVTAPIVMLFSIVMWFMCEVTDCPRCLSFHLAWLMMFFILKYPIAESLLLAPLSIVGVYIIEYLCEKRI